MEEWDRLVADLHGEDVDRACAAAEALDRAADESWLPRLHELLLGGADFFIREAAAAPVARLQGLRAVDALLRALWLGEDEGHDNDGLQALISDVVLADPAEAAPVLLGMLQDAFERRRASAAWLLGYASEAITPEPLLATLRDPSPDVRSAAAGSLGEFQGREDVFIALCQALGDDDAQVRRSAAAALGDLGDRRAEPLLEKLLTTDPSEWTRSIAANAQRRLQG